MGPWNPVNGNNQLIWENDFSLTLIELVYDLAIKTLKS